MNAREEIMQSIRANLAQSALIPSFEHSDCVQTALTSNDGRDFGVETSPITRFRERLESVGGHCVVVRNETEAAEALRQIIDDLRRTTKADRIALSDAPLLSDLTSGLPAEQVSVCPAVPELFSHDVGVTLAQAAIAETGTLILELEKERNRLISLLPPVHIAVVRSDDICPTIGDALRMLHGNNPKQMSRAISFITGPSRTADIELTLTVGVHGPKELHVIVIG